MICGIKGTYTEGRKLKNVLQPAHKYDIYDIYECIYKWHMEEHIWRSHTGHKGGLIYDIFDPFIAHGVYMI
jgi:hypothetical protein